MSRCHRADLVTPAPCTTTGAPETVDLTVAPSWSSNILILETSHVLVLNVLYKSIQYMKPVHSDNGPFPVLPYLFHGFGCSSSLAEEGTCTSLAALMGPVASMISTSWTWKPGGEAAKVNDDVPLFQPRSHGFLQNSDTQNAFFTRHEKVSQTTSKLVKLV